MHYRIPGLLFLVATFILTGCIETQMLVTVKKDGSGTIRETLKMKKAMLEPLKEMAAAMKEATEEIGEEPSDAPRNDARQDETDQDATPPSLDIFSDQEIRGNAAKLGRGVRYVSHEMHDDDEMQGYTALYSFDDINTVHVNQNPGASVPTLPGGEEMMESDEELVLFSFTPGNPATLVIRPPKGDESESAAAQGEPEEEETDEQQTSDEQQTTEGEQSGEEGFEQMKEFLRDMKVLVQVAVEGKIAQSNATYIDGSTITVIDLNFNSLIDDPELLKKLEKSDEMGPAAAKEMLKNIPGIRVETEEEITVTFK